MGYVMLKIENKNEKEEKVIETYVDFSWKKVKEKYALKVG